MDDADPLQLAIVELLEEWYRVCKEDPNRPCMGWPIQRGGTFVDFAQRLWADKDSFVHISATTMVKLGLLESVDHHEFVKVTRQVSGDHPWQPGHCTTSVFMWSMADESFWKPFMPMSEIMPIDKSIALSGYRQDKYFLKQFLTHVILNVVAEIIRPQRRVSVPVKLNHAVVG